MFMDSGHILFRNSPRVAPRRATRAAAPPLRRTTAQARSLPPLSPERPVGSPASCEEDGGGANWLLPFCFLFPPALRLRAVIHGAGSLPSSMVVTQPLPTGSGSLGPDPDPPGPDLRRQAVVRRGAAALSGGGGLVRGLYTGRPCHLSPLAPLGLNFDAVVGVLVRVAAPAPRASVPRRFARPPPPPACPPAAVA
nr:unnamed protein product [Digitaria exilis]